MSEIQKPKGLLLVMMEIDPAYDDDFNRWYNEEHIPERMSCPGFLGARRFVATEGEPKYLCLYDLNSADAVNTPEYRHRLGNPTPWTEAMHDYNIKTIRNVYTEIPIT